jgi:hypothetical protein
MHQPSEIAYGFEVSSIAFVLSLHTRYDEQIAAVEEAFLVRDDAEDTTEAANVKEAALKLIADAKLVDLKRWRKSNDQYGKRLFGRLVLDLYKKSEDDVTSDDDSKSSSSSSSGESNSTRSGSRSGSGSGSDSDDDTGSANEEDDENTAEHSEKQTHSDNNKKKKNNVPVFDLEIYKTFKAKTMQNAMDQYDIESVMDILTEGLSKDYMSSK